MSVFFKRLKVYAIGFGIGCIFVFFFFQNRGCSWLPDNRVKNSILDRAIVIQEDVAQSFDEKGINDKAIIELLNSGKVNFKKSQKDGPSKTYLIYKDNLRLYFTLPEESYISEVRMADQPAAKIHNSTSGSGKFIHFPNDEDLIFADTMAKITCQQQSLGMIQNKMIYKSLKENGSIDFSKTDFTIKPKPEQYINFNDPKGRRIGAKTIWYKNKITIFEIELPFENNCQ